MALLVPVIVYSFVALGINYANKNYENDDDVWQGIASAGGFIVIVLALNAIIKNDRNICDNS